MRWLVVWLVPLAACAAETSAMRIGDENGGCTDNSATVALTAEPAVVARNAEVEIILRWEVTFPLVDPWATLRVGDSPVVEVDVPLTAASSVLYQGSVMNPFGAGAPTGEVEVLAEGSPDPGCIVFPTASTAFILE